MLIVANLLHPSWIMPIRVLPGNFVKHLHKVHVHTGIPLDELLELLEGGCELFLGVRVNVGGYVGEVLTMDAMVSREPCARPEKTC